MKKKEPEEIKREYRARQTRQIIAMTAALFLVILAAVFYRRPDLVGGISRSTLFGMQAIAIGAFLGYSYNNWRCPACGKYLGSNIHRVLCRKCGARLQ